MSAPRIFLVAGLAVAGVEALLAVAFLGTVLAAYFGVCAALTAVIAVVARGLLAPPDEGDDDGRGGPPGPPDDEPPPWWPEFEAQLRAYERARRRAPV